MMIIRSKCSSSEKWHRVSSKSVACACIVLRWHERWSRWHERRSRWIHSRAKDRFIEACRIEANDSETIRNFATTNSTSFFSESLVFFRELVRPLRRRFSFTNLSFKRRGLWGVVADDVAGHWRRRRNSSLTFHSRHPGCSRLLRSKSATHHRVSRHTRSWNSQ